MKRLLFLGLLLVALLCELSAQDVKVSARVNDDTVSVGKPFTCEFQMQVPYGYYVEWNDFAKDTLSEQIDIYHRGEIERTADADSNTIVRQELSLMTFDTGVVVIPGVALTYARNADDPMRMQAYTNTVSLYAKTITVDTTQAFRPFVPPIDQPMTMKEVFPWLLGFLLVVIAAIATVYFVRRRKRPLDENGQPVKGPVIPPYTKAIDSLERLRLQKLWQEGKVKEYYSSLTDIAREYIEGQFAVNAVEMTTDDILTEIRSLCFDERIFNKLKASMELSDLVKFAKFETTSLENDMAMNDMVDFVNESYAFYQEQKAQEEKVAEEMKPEEKKEEPQHV